MKVAKGVFKKIGKSSDKVTTLAMLKGRMGPEMGIDVRLNKRISYLDSNTITVKSCSEFTL